MGIFCREKSISRREKNQENYFSPSEKYYSYTPARMPVLVWGFGPGVLVFDK